MRAVRLLLALSLVALLGCRGKVLDPVGDAVTAEGSVDVTAAGVDYRTSHLELWVRYADPGTPPGMVTWHLSMNDDTTPEVHIRLGDNFATLSDRYTVTLHVNPGSIVESCAGYVSDGGFDGSKTKSIKLDPRCLGVDEHWSLWPNIRVSASTDYGRYSHDETGYTGLVFLSD